MVNNEDHGLSVEGQLLTTQEIFPEHTAHAQTVPQTPYEAACCDVTSSQQGIHNIVSIESNIHVFKIGSAVWQNEDNVVPRPTTDRGRF